MPLAPTLKKDNKHSIIGRSTPGHRFDGAVVINVMGLDHEAITKLLS